LSEALQPVPAGRRILLLDVLRGLAIFGMLVVHMPFMNAPVVLMIATVRLWKSLPDRIMETVICLFFEGKFYPLFALLFGYGFWLFINKSATDGRSVLKLYTRRVIILFFIGILHAALLWAGDVLIFFALFGLLLIAFRKTPDKKLIRWAIAFLLMPAVLVAAMTLAVGLAGLAPHADAAVQATLAEHKNFRNVLVNEAWDVYARGSFIEIVRTRVAEWLALLEGFVFYYPAVMGMFLLGMLAARRRLAAESEKHLPLFRKIFRWGLTIGLPANIVFAVIASWRQVGDVTWTNILAIFCFGVGGAALSLAYVSGVVLLLRKGPLQKTAGWLAPVGRMALTNYLLHSLISAILFHSYGFGLFGKMDLWQSFLLALTVFAAQAAGSRLWLSRFRFGPVEWLWRSLTYRRLQPMRYQSPRTPRI